MSGYPPSDPYSQPPSYQPPGGQPPGYQPPGSQPPGWTGAPPSGSGPVPGFQAPGTGGGGPPSRDQLGGFWIRFLAAIIDGILVSIVAAILTVPLGVSPFSFSASFEAGSSSGGTSAGNPGGNPVGSLIQTVVGAAYAVYLIGSPAGQTLGMKATGLRVADVNTGGRVTYGRSVARYAMGIVSAIPFGLGYLWMLWDPRRQTWHDKVAQTVVVKTRYFPPPAAFGKPS